MSTPNPVLTAAAPAIVAVLQAAKQLITNLGADPAQIVAKAPGAFSVFVGTVEMQFPSLVSAELGAVQTDVNAKIDALIAKLHAATPAA